MFQGFPGATGSEAQASRAGLGAGGPGSKDSETGLSAARKTKHICCGRQVKGWWTRREQVKRAGALATPMWREFSGDCNCRDLESRSRSQSSLGEGPSGFGKDALSCGGEGGGWRALNAQLGSAGSTSPLSPCPRLGPPATLAQPPLSAGEHPRMGALDVCPFIPVRGVSMDECVLCAQAFGQRLAEELGVPGECPERDALAGAPPAGPPAALQLPQVLCTRKGGCGPLLGGGSGSHALPRSGRCSAAP